MSDQPKQTHRINHGKWRKTEHARFVTGMHKFGRNWVKVQHHVGTRTLIQVRSHAQKYFMGVEGTEYMKDKESRRGRCEEDDSWGCGTE